MSDYSAQLQIQNALSGAIMTPGNTQLGTLATLKLLQQSEDLANKGGAIGLIAAEEMKYLKLAMNAVSGNSLIKDKFGSGFSGVQTVAAMLKQHESQAVYTGIMDTILEKGGSAHNVAARVKDRGAFK